MKNRIKAAMIKRSLIRVLVLLCSPLSLILLAVAYAYYVEPSWLRVTHVRLSSNPAIRLVHVTDIHHKGDAAYLNRVVKIINGLDVDIVCFTGDLIEEATYLPEALDILSGIKKPLYGIPGNHDLWEIHSANLSGACSNAFEKTGGQWLPDQSLLPAHAVNGKHIMLSHYPYGMDEEGGAKLDLVLSGHTHGGQVRPAWLRRLIVSFDLWEFNQGLFQTPKGPLYVNPGIGTFFVPMRFLCRPEITVIEL